MREKIKIFFVSDDTVLLLFGGVARISNLPEGCTLGRAFYDHTRRGFGIIVGHDSFEPVEDGCEPPLMKVELEMVDVRR